MKIVALRNGIGRIDDDGSIAELDLPYPSLSDGLRAGACTPDLARAPVRGRWPLDDASVIATDGWGACVWGVGLNYHSKMVATGRERPVEPVLYVKSPSSAGTGHVPVELPVASECVDYEGEIAVVMGADVYQCGAAEARRAVAGVVAANDITARDVMKRSGNPSLAKSFPGFGQIGCVVEVIGFAGRLDAIPIEVEVNGELRQRDSSAGMLVPIDELIALVSRYALLRSGDIVLTGTPAGTGDESNSFLGPDDVVEVRVADLPPLRTRFTAPMAGRTERL